MLIFEGKILEIKLKVNLEGIKVKLILFEKVSYYNRFSFYFRF